MSMLLNGNGGSSGVAVSLHGVEKEGRTSIWKMNWGVFWYETWEAY